MPEYTLLRSRRRTLILQIQASGALLVRAPQRMSKREIDAFVASKQQWLEHHLAQLPSPPVPWLEGRPWWHLGRAYQVTINDAVSAREAILLTDNLISIPAALCVSNEAITAALKVWQLKQAKVLMPECVARHVQRLGAQWQPAHVGVRHMKTRWGSCSVSRRISLNAALLHMPPGCLDYVICHELAHLQEMNHGARFYATQTLLNPQWQEQQALLRQWAKQVSAGVAYEPDL